MNIQGMKCAKSCLTSWSGIFSCPTQPSVHWALLSEAAVFTGKAEECLDCTLLLKLTPAVKDLYNWLWWNFAKMPG